MCAPIGKKPAPGDYESNDKISFLRLTNLILKTYGNIKKITYFCQIQTKYIISFDKLVNNDKNEIKLIEKEENISQDNLSIYLII